MINDILLYCWGSNSESLIMQQMDRLNISYIEFEREMKDYHADSGFAEEMMKVIHDKEIKAVFSFDYFPLISMICEINNIPYIVWIYDCPMLTLQSGTLVNESNHIYCFDGKYAKRLEEEGAKHCYHFPLGGNGELLPWIREQERRDRSLADKYVCDISFVGNLYNEKKNRFRSAVFDDYTRGFLESVIDTQKKIYGYNFVKEVLPDTIVDEVVEKCELKLGNMYRQDKRQMAADALNMEISAREREAVLKILGSEYQVILYTGSKIPVELNVANIKNRGYADYNREMPFIFHNSKINLNMTSRSIETGVPLRVFDILSCGGFCLTNYQPEIADLFEDGSELVMYTDMQDMVDKVRYYLEHDEERQKIAESGYQKLVAQFNLVDRVAQILEREGSIAS